MNIIFISLLFLLVCYSTALIKAESYSSSGLPDDIQPGDILFCDTKTNEMFGNSNDHCAMYIGNEEFIHAIPVLGVVKQSYSTIKTVFLESSFVYGKVISSSDSQRQDAIQWAKDRLGRPYQGNNPGEGFKANWDPEIDNKWYCSELIWAAYYNQGIYLHDEWQEGSDIPIYIMTRDNDIEMNENIPPAVLIEIRREGINPKQINFYAGYSIDTDGYVTSFKWDFENDGIFDTSWQESSEETHNYPSFDEYTVRLMIKDNNGETSQDTKTFSIIQNVPPNKPDTPIGPTTGKTNIEYEFQFRTTDPDEDQVYYSIYWEINSLPDEWYGPYESGESVIIKHKWSEKGNHPIFVQAKDSNGYKSGISSPFYIDINQEGSKSKKYQISNLFDNSFVYDLNIILLLKFLALL